MNTLSIRFVLIFLACTASISLSAQWLPVTGTTPYNIYNTNEGNVGIGVPNPGWKLDVRTHGVSGSDQYCLNIQNPSTAAYAAVQIDLRVADGSVGSTLYAQRDNLTKASTTSFFNTDATGAQAIKMQIFGNGTVGIGNTSPNFNYKLDVGGSIRANKVVVNTNGADYVFDPAYHLAPLAELADSIRSSHHLPGIAPASQMQKDGMDVGDNATRLLAKVEELTLYIIQQNERMDNFNQELEKLKKQAADLQKQNEQLQRQNQQLKSGNL